jgi:CMP-N-acetylneuraminic acid synthetase
VRIIGLILAKGDSKRLPRKNFKKIAGKPMFVWNLEKCLEVFDEVYVSSENEYVLEIARANRAKTIVRLKRLCGETPNIPVYKHALREAGYPDAIVAVQACSPTIDKNLIKRAKKVMESGCQEMMTCYPARYLKDYYDQSFKIYGSIWGITKKRLIEYENYYLPRPEVLLVDDSKDIHTKEDFNQVKKWLQIHQSL